MLVQVDAPPGVDTWGAPNGQPDMEILVSGLRALDAADFIL